MSSLSNFRAQPQLVASAGLVIGGALWGLIWVPIRWLGDLGLSSAWAGFVIYGGTCLVLTALIALRIIRLSNFGFPLVLCGVLTGAAFSFYSTSLLLTDVVRAVLLFYLTPIWGTGLGIAFLGERLTIHRSLALILAVIGLLIVLGIGANVPLPQNAGDWLALASGVAWAVGTLVVYKLSQVQPIEQVTAFAFGALIVTVATMLAAPGLFAGGANFGTALSHLPLGLLLAAYVLPMLFLTIWPARILTPARVGVLLMSDVIVGVGSAALFAGEPFGWREGLGSVLIILAALIDVAGTAKR